MATEKISLKTFAEEFLSHARAKRTGTYKVVCEDGRERYLLWRAGSIIDVDTREEESLLTSVILATGQVSDRELKKARKAQSKNQAPLGALLLGQVALPEEELLSAVLSRMADEICALFATKLAQTAFIEHQADERLEGFASELSEILEVHADPEELFLEAARRLARWDLVERGFSLLRDVYYATPAAFRYFQDEARYRQQVLIIGLIDGRNDVGEVVRKSTEQLQGELDPFQALSIIRSLFSSGEVQVLSPVQLFQLGVEYQAGKDHQKALKLYTRASERGLDDFDLCFKIAETLEALGRRPEAALRYQEFGEKCLVQFRPDDALKSFRKAGELEPKSLLLQRKVLEILLQENRREEALEQGLALASRHAAEGEGRAGLHLLLDLRHRGFKDDRLAQRIVDLAEESGDEATAKSERKRLAGEFVARKDVEKALQMYQQMFCEGNSSPEVRLKLIELHQEKGNHPLVLEHIAALLSLPDSERIKDLAVLRRLHELVVELKPGESRSHRWLVEFHLRAGNREAALTLLRNQAAHFERQGESWDSVRVLRQLVSLDADSSDPRWRLVKAYEKLGKSAERVEEMKELARLALKQEDSREAERAYQEILKTAPFDLETRKALGELCAARGETARAAGSYKEVALLDILSGNLPEALEYCRRLLSIEPGDPEVIRRLGDLCRALGDDQKATEELVKAARFHLEQKNLGIAREALSGALKFKAADGEALEVLRSLDELEASLGGKRPVEAAPATVTRHGRENQEPFQPSGPVIKKSVAGITARLKNLKSGGTTSGVPQAPVQAAEGGAASEAGAAAGGPAAPAAGAAGARRAGGAGVVSAASKLKALAAGGGSKKAAPPPREETPAAAPEEGEDAEDEPRKKPASKEKAAKSAPAGAQEERGSGEPTPVNLDAQELARIRASVAGAASPVRAESSGNSKTRSLGKSAALLARIRKRPEEAETPPQDIAETRPEREMDKELG
jgi:tetratricopeptide (TPR) repeat protein